MTNLARRKGSANWYYRETLPGDVYEILLRRFGKAPREVWRSLGTPDRNTAKSRRAAIQAAQHQEWEQVRTSANPSSDLPSKAEMADAVVEHVYERFMDVHYRRLREQVRNGLDTAAEVKRRRNTIFKAALLPEAEDRTSLERLAAFVSKQNGWKLDPNNQLVGGLWSELVEMVGKAVQYARRGTVDFLEGKPMQVHRERVIEHLGVEPVKAAKPGETIMELFDRYAADHKRDGSKKLDTLNAERKIMTHFSTVVGSRRSVSDIGRSDIRDVKRVLAVVPERWVARGDLKGLNIVEAAAKWDASGGAGRSPRTVARELSAISSFFGWMIDNDYYPEDNPTAGFFPKKLEKVKNKYPPYTEKQLAALLNSPLFHACREKKPHQPGSDRVRDWRYWLPLCALFSGARTGEIAQLHCDDIRQELAVWVFDFNDEGGNETGSKSLKTASSRRIVPLHPSLVSLGFLDHVQAVRGRGARRLFPEIEPGPRGDMSYRPSRFWQRYLERIGLKEPGLALHSFRHTFADECRRAEVSRDVLRGLLGHSDGSQTGHYGSIAVGTLRQRQAAIEALTFYGLLEALLEPAG